MDKETSTFNSSVSNTGTACNEAISVCQFHLCVSDCAEMPTHRVVLLIWSLAEPVERSPVDDWAARCQAWRRHLETLRRVLAVVPRLRSRELPPCDERGRRHGRSTDMSDQAPPCWPCTAPPDISCHFALLPQPAHRNRPCRRHPVTMPV